MTHLYKKPFKVRYIDVLVKPIVYSVEGILDGKVVALLKVSFQLLRSVVKHHFKHQELCKSFLDQRR